MPASQFAKDVTSATIDFWATTANGTSLGSHAAGLAESAQQNEIQGLTTRIQTIGDIVQTTDSLIRPVIQLATIDNASIANTGWGAAGKVLKGAGTAAMFTSWLADTASLQDTLADLKATDAQKQSKFEAWLLGTGAFVIGVGALAASAPALVAVLGVTAMGLTVASIIAEKNTGSVNAPLLRSMRSGLTDLFQGVRKATNEAPTYLNQLKADIVGFGADVAGAGRKYAQRYAAVIEAEVNRFSGSPVTYLKDLAGSAYAYISQNLSDGSAYVARLIGAVIDGETDQLLLNQPTPEQSRALSLSRRTDGRERQVFRSRVSLLSLISPRSGPQWQPNYSSLLAPASSRV